MAHSKSGGTRSYIRGKIGADVYSIGKDGKGKRQQVVRSLAEQVSNPQTEAQMKGRMYMSTVMQAVSALSPIIDHSFDNVPNGQPSISEFISRNYALIKADAEAHPASGNVFGLNKYQEKGIKAGHYVVSKGEIVNPAAIAATSSGLRITKLATDTTAGAIRSLLGVAVGDFFTFVAIVDSWKAIYFRVKVTDTLSDSTTLTSGNIGQLFDIEGNCPVAIQLDTTSITIVYNGVDTVYVEGMITSQKVAGAWKHSNCQLDESGADTFEWTSNVALPTYPQGSARFLNGGDI